jgi:post-segregation antitoxin (ccd killing protein)
MVEDNGREASIFTHHVQVELVASNIDKLPRWRVLAEGIVSGNALVDDSGCDDDYRDSYWNKEGN